MKNLLLIICFSITINCLAQKKYTTATESAIANTYTSFAGNDPVNVISKYSLFLNSLPVVNIGDSTVLVKIIMDKNRGDEYPCGANRCLDYFYNVMAQDSSYIDTITIHYTYTINKPYKVIDVEIKSSTSILYVLANEYWRSARPQIKAPKFKYSDTEGYFTFTDFTDKITFALRAPAMLQGRLFIEAK
jgi:hypothetical protein